eukprot:3835369-Amphidinium_carterae.1
MGSPGQLSAEQVGAIRCWKVGVLAGIFILDCQHPWQSRGLDRAKMSLCDFSVCTPRASCR